MRASLSNQKKSAFVVPVDNQFVCVADKKIIGKSKRPGYFEHNFRTGHMPIGQRDVVIEQFVYVDQTGHIDHINPIETPPEEVIQSLKNDIKYILRNLKPHVLTH